MIIYISIIYLIITIERKSVSLKTVLFIVLFTILVNQTHRIDPYTRVTFIDIYGDAILMQSPYDNCNILIDTGERDRYDTVIQYLKSKHIKRLDYAIISHFHSDHYGEIQDINSELFITNLITNQTAISYENQWIQCGQFQVYIYPMSYNNLNENNNSIIVSVMVEGKHYLFVGDTEADREMEFLSHYHVDVDYLKVGHHGSITSTTESFLDTLTPEEVFITVHRDNRHGHPNDIIISRFIERNITVHRTDLSGTIEVTYLWGKERKKYHSP